MIDIIIVEKTRILHSHPQGIKLGAPERLGIHSKQLFYVLII